MVSRFSVLRIFSAILFVFCSSAASIAAETTDARPGFVLLPENGTPIATSVSGGLHYGLSSGGALRFDLFQPLRRDEDSALLLDLGVAAGLSSDFDFGGVTARAGLVYRKRQDERHIYGLNAYIEGAKPAGSDSFMGLLSFGGEYEIRSQDQLGFTQIGGNLYIPFDDYTDTQTYGRQAAAPRAGVDAYVSVGRSYDAFALRGTLAGFHYLETDSAFPLTGYRADAEIELTKGLPPNMSVIGSIGLRDDNRRGSDPEVVVGVEVSVALGGSAQDIARDCALIQEANQRPRVDCSERVIPGGGGSSKVSTKTGTTMISQASHAVATPVHRPRRHLGYDGPLTPIEYKDSSLQIVKRTRGGDGTFSFVSSAVALGGSVTTVNGRGSTGAVAVQSGVYTISEVNLPQGWSLETASCTGGLDSRVDLATRRLSVEVLPGARVVCTFTNRYQEPASSDETNVIPEPEDSRTGAISGRLFKDLDHNGVDDDGGTPVGMPVALLDDQGRELATTVIDASGFYRFEGLAAGTYSIRVPRTFHSWLGLTEQHMGGDDSRDSDADMTGHIHDIVLSEGAHIENVNAGYIATSMFSGGMGAVD